MEEKQILKGIRKFGGYHGKTDNAYKARREWGGDEHNFQEVIKK